MKWLNKAKKPEPKERDCRVITEFAWWPVWTDNGCVVWLEKYAALQWYIWRSADGYIKHHMAWATIGKFADKTKAKENEPKPSFLNTWLWCVASLSLLLLLAVAGLAALCAFIAALMGLGWLVQWNAWVAIVVVGFGFTLGMAAMHQYSSASYSLVVDTIDWVDGIFNRIDQKIAKKN